MSEAVEAPSSGAAVPTVQDVAAAIPAVKSGARWFWWIAGLSVVNTAMYQSGSNTSFVLGLAFTALSDVIFEDSKIIGFALDAVALGFFFAMGLFAQRGKLWAFYVGTIVYVIDALIYVRFQNWMSVGFHAFAIFYIFRGAMELRRALRPTS